APVVSRVAESFRFALRRGSRAVLGKTEARIRVAAVLSHRAAGMAVLSHQVLVSEVRARDNAQRRIAFCIALGLAPLGDVAEHVEKPECVGLARRDRVAVLS